MNLNIAMNHGIARIMRNVTRYYMNTQPGREFISSALPMIKQAGAVRAAYEKLGTHIPPFLIASIASQCNLHCAGCYARAGGTCCEGNAQTDLTAAQWRNIFIEARSLGIAFILLAGGEPFIRRDVLSEAGKCADVVFPIFTNGTMLDSAYIDMLDVSRNLVPVLSIEGDAAQTDARRGAGTYARLNAAMEELHARNILFGASITLTHDNIDTVLSDAYMRALHTAGCGLVFLIEYVPVEAGTERLVLSADDMRREHKRVRRLKYAYGDMIVLAFPGDEKDFGGCLASGRGFFHINPHGGAEPCPFSPNSIHNLSTSSIIDVLNSEFFCNLRTLAAATTEHSGGCTLYEQREQVGLMRADSQVDGMG